MTASDAPLRIAFLGADETTAELVSAVLADRRCELAGVCEFDAGRSPDAAVLRSVPGQRPVVPQWEDLLDQGRFDAVIVARGDDEDLRAEQLRKFVQTGMPVLAAHPVVGSMLIYYELDMIRRETHAPLVPLLAERNHPAVQTLADAVRAADSPIGKVDHLSFERSLSRPSKTEVVRQFARDVDLVRAVAGDMTRLGAMGGAAGEAAYSSLGVQMSGPEGIAARWTVVPIDRPDGARITLTGPRGRAVLTARGGLEPWTIEWDAGGESRRQEFPAWDRARAALEELVAAVRQGCPQPDWVDACRDIELSETIERSLAKSRTIELYYEDYTEEGTFKGTMTSLGCGLLLLAMFTLGVVGVAEQMNLPLVRYWPYVLVALFGVFLALQLVMLTKRKGSDEPPAASESG